MLGPANLFRPALAGALLFNLFAARPTPLRTSNPGLGPAFAAQALSIRGLPWLQSLDVDFACRFRRMLSETVAPAGSPHGIYGVLQDEFTNVWATPQEIAEKTTGGRGPQAQLSARHTVLPDLRRLVRLGLVEPDGHGRFRALPLDADQSFQVEPIVTGLGARPSPEALLKAAEEIRPWLPTFDPPQQAFDFTPEGNGGRPTAEKRARQIASQRLMPKEVCTRVLAIFQEPGGLREALKTRLQDDPILRSQKAEVMETAITRLFETTLQMWIDENGPAIVTESALATILRSAESPRALEEKLVDVRGIVAAQQTPELFPTLEVAGDTIEEKLRLLNKSWLGIQGIRHEFDFVSRPGQVNGDVLSDRLISGSLRLGEFTGRLRLSTDGRGNLRLATRFEDRNVYLVSFPQFLTAVLEAASHSRFQTVRIELPVPDSEAYFKAVIARFVRPGALHVYTPAGFNLDRPSLASALIVDLAKLDFTGILRPLRETFFARVITGLSPRAMLWYIRLFAPIVDTVQYIYVYVLLPSRFLFLQMDRVLHFGRDSESVFQAHLLAWAIMVLPASMLVAASAWLFERDHGQIYTLSPEGIKTGGASPEARERIGYRGLIYGIVGFMLYAAAFLVPILYGRGMVSSVLRDAAFAAPLIWHLIDNNLPFWSRRWRERFIRGGLPVSTIAA
jgi:hypothetical protein